MKNFKLNLRFFKLDTYLKVFTGSCGNLSCVGFNDDIQGTNFQSQVVFEAQAGATYFIRVGGFASQQGTFGLTFECGGGCLDPLACNYQENAPFDDGSCTYGADCYGCTDQEASNYEPQAVYNEGFSVAELMPANTVGIVTARDALTIDMDKEALWARVQDFTQSEPEVLRERYALGEDVPQYCASLLAVTTKKYY